MLVITSPTELIKTIDEIKETEETIAFVPTMGNLHEGHLNLISLAHKKATIVIVSIFVNPLQFNQSEDLINYPRTLEQDSKLCEQKNVNIIFAPSVSDFYPDEKKDNRIELPELSFLSNTLEGASRPDHFSGVATVVKKLFDLVRPDVAIFGEKDFQQLLLITKMVEVLNIPVKIISSETIREADGLAMSSRNSKLSSDERLLAVNLYQVLKSIRDSISLGENTISELIKDEIGTLTESGFKLDYLVVRNAETLQETKPDDSSANVILIAAWLGNTRLIDNLRL